MYLRKLKTEDAPFMLEWMKDGSVTEFLRSDFKNKEEDDCVRFIENSLSDKKNIHMAIANDDGEYQGTVSLKNIGLAEGYAEFAVTVRKSAMGKGYSAFGMKEIIRLAHEELHIGNVIWCVSENNVRAIKFYAKMGYSEDKNIPEAFLKLYGSDPPLIWFGARRAFLNDREEISNG